MTAVDGTVSEIYRAMLLLLQRACSAADRERIAEVFGRIVNDKLGHPPPPVLAKPDEAIVDALTLEGCCRIASLLSPQQAAEIRAHFEARPCYNGHVPPESDKVPRRRGAGAETFHYGSYSLADILEAPYLLELASSPRLLAIAERYLGCVPTLYSMNAWWSFGGHPVVSPYAQRFHRDLDDFRFCTLFVYLTDVTETSGPHVFVRRSHRASLLRSHLEGSRSGQAGLRRFSETDQARLLGGDLFEGEGYGTDLAIEAVFPELIEVIVGPAGTGLLADTGGFHKGMLPLDGDRLIFWARYGVYTNLGPLSPPVPWARVAHRLPPTDRLRYVNRQILKDGETA